MRNDQMARQPAYKPTQATLSSEAEDRYATPRWAKVFGSAAALGVAAFVIIRFVTENLETGMGLPLRELLMIGLGVGLLIFAIVVVRLTAFGRSEG